MRFHPQGLQRADDETSMEWRAVQGDLLDVHHEVPTRLLQQIRSKYSPKDAKRDQVSLYKLPSNRPDIVSLFESMTPYFNSKIQPTDELLQLKMVEGVYVLLNTDKNLYASIFDFTDPWKIDILEFMERNYMNDISMEEIANYTGRSLSTFKRDFKKCSALSPREWLIQRRLEAAHGLIRKGGRKVSEICFEVGFKNLSHFSKIYKIAYGVPPTEDI